MVCSVVESGNLVAGRASQIANRRVVRVYTRGGSFGSCSVQLINGGSSQCFYGSFVYARLFSWKSIYACKRSLREVDEGAYRTIDN